MANGENLIMERLDALEREVGGLRNTVEKQKKDIKRKNQFIRKLKQDVEGLTVKVEDLEEDVKCKDQTIGRLTEELRRRDQTIERLTEQIADRDYRMETLINQYNRLNEEQRNGEQGRSIFRRMSDYAREHPYIVCGAVAAGICTGVFAYYGVPLVCAAVGKVVVISVKSATLKGCAVGAAGTGAAALLVSGSVASNRH